MVNDRKYLRTEFIYTVVLSIFFLFSFSSCQQGPNQSTVEVPSDSTITETVLTQFEASDEVPEQNIEVSTREGIVTLNGSTTNLLGKNKATDIAQSTKGVLSVINNLKITTDRPDEAIEEDVVRAIATDPVTETWEIAVTVENGVVTLKGRVESWQEKQLVEHITEGVRGVKSINNVILVSQEAQRSDDEIKQEIERTLMMDSRIDDNMVEVSVDSGKVNLSGSIGSAREKSLAKELAQVAGVKSVAADRLQVKPEINSEMFRNQLITSLTAEEIKEAIKNTLKYDPRVPESKIDVAVEEGTAILSGTVQNLNAKMSAEEDARHTAGVNEVVNEIEVEQKVVVTPEVPTSDEAIHTRILEAVKRDPYVETTDLKVTVEDGLAELEGTVDNAFKKKQITEVASKVKGVIAVNNNMKIAAESNSN